MDASTACIICHEHTSAPAPALHTHSCLCHPDCLATWLQAKATCPVCRDPMYPEADLALSEAAVSVITHYIHIAALFETTESAIEAGLVEAIAKLPEHNAQMEFILETMCEAALIENAKRYNIACCELDSELRRVQNDPSANLYRLSQEYMARIDATA